MGATQNECGLAKHVNSSMRSSEMSYFLASTNLRLTLTPSGQIDQL